MYNHFYFFYIHSMTDSSCTRMHFLLYNYVWDSSVPPFPLATMTYPRGDRKAKGDTKKSIYCIYCMYYYCTIYHHISSCLKTIRIILSLFHNLYNNHIFISVFGYYLQANTFMKLSIVECTTVVHEHMYNCTCILTCYITNLDDNQFKS